MCVCIFDFHLPINIGLPFIIILYCPTNIRGVVSRLKAVINEREDEKRISKAKNDTKTRKKMKDEEEDERRRERRVTRNEGSSSSRKVERRSGDR